MTTTNAEQFFRGHAGMGQFFRSYTGIFRISRQFSGTSKSEKSAIMMANRPVYSVPELCWNSQVL